MTAVRELHLPWLPPTTLTRDEDSNQQMIVVENHRNKYGIFKKSDLKSVFTMFIVCVIKTYLLSIDILNQYPTLILDLILRLLNGCGK